MILVSGGAGVMGSRLVRGLVEKGKRVRVLALPGDPFISRLDRLDCDIRYADITDAASLDRVFEGVKTTFHLASVLIARDPAVFQLVNVDGTRNMVDGSIESGVAHFIFVSSISVTYPNPTPYALSKKEGESIVKGQKAMEYTIIRPTLTYSDSGGEEFMMFTKALLWYPIVPLVGRRRALKNPVHVDDLVRGFLAVLDNPKTFGKTYNFCGGEEITMWDLAHLILKHHGISKPFVPIPLPICKLVAGVAAKTMKNPMISSAITGMIQDANPDYSSARKDLDYKPVGIRGGLQKCFPI